ncbi:hypothetical protein N431DRAFT_429255 [Stipitochalara longipes BDJ]|nr:hypothetical protein N431DRAFT_429255 [Stipitochalara longipes BDJ]
MSVRGSPSSVIAEDRALSLSLKTRSLTLDEADETWRDKRKISDPPIPSYAGSGSQERERGASKMQTADIAMTAAHHLPPQPSRGRPPSGQPRVNTAVDPPPVQHSISSTERESRDSPARSSQVSFKMSDSSNSSHAADSPAKAQGPPSISDVATESRILRPGSAAENEWDRIQKLRNENWGLRSQIREMRNNLRHLQLEKSKADDILFRRLTVQGLGLGHGSYIPPGQKSLDELMHDCQVARDAYGPLEDDCNQLEDKLSALEFELDRLEQAFYKRPPDEISVLSERPPTPAGVDDSQQYPSSVEEEEEEIAYHPRVARYLSKMGDLDLLQERLDDLLDEKRLLEEEQKKRLKFGLVLDGEDQQWLDHAHSQEEALLAQIRILEKDLDVMKQDCLARGLVDEDGEPVEFQIQEQRTFDNEEDLDPFGQKSEYVKYPLLLPTPGAKSRREMHYEHRPDEKSDTNTDPNKVTSSDRYHRINEWLLAHLRGSALDVNLLARTFQNCYGVIDTPHRWQIAVLRLWFRDATVKNAASLLHVGTESMTTQAPAISNNASGSFKRERGAEEGRFDHLARSVLEDDDLEIVEGPTTPRRRENRHPIELSL